jgi:hypothetical protein
VNDDDDSLHGDLPSQADAADYGPSLGLAGFSEKFGRCYTIIAGIVTPADKAAASSHKQPWCEPHDLVPSCRFYYN